MWSDDISEDIRKAVRYFQQGLEFYRSRDWARAESSFRRALTKKAGDKPSQIFLQRCVSCREAKLLDNWEGVFTCTTK